MVSSDGQYGDLDTNGNWTGLIGDLLAQVRGYHGMRAKAFMAIFMHKAYDA